MKTVIRTLLGITLLGGSLCAFSQSERRAMLRTEPEYPSIAVKMNLHGTVKLKVWITPEGKVRRLEYVGGHQLLAESALQAVKRWKYAPAAAETTQIVDVKF